MLFRLIVVGLLIATNLGEEQGEVLTEDAQSKIIAPNSEEHLQEEANVLLVKENEHLLSEVLKHATELSTDDRKTHDELARIKADDTLTHEELTKLQQKEKGLEIKEAEEERELEEELRHEKMLNSRLAEAENHEQKQKLLLENAQNLFKKEAADLEKVHEMGEKEGFMNGLATPFAVIGFGVVCYMFYTAHRKCWKLAKTQIWWERKVNVLRTEPKEEVNSLLEITDAANME